MMEPEQPVQPIQPIQPAKSMMSVDELKAWKFERDSDKVVIDDPIKNLKIDDPKSFDNKIFDAPNWKGFNALDSLFKNKPGSTKIVDKMALDRVNIQRKLSNWGDADKDGVPNILDCQPLNPKKQDTILDNYYEQNPEQRPVPIESRKQKAKRYARATGRGAKNVVSGFFSGLGQVGRGFSEFGNDLRGPAPKGKVTITRNKKGKVIRRTVTRPLRRPDPMIQGANKVSFMMGMSGNGGFSKKKKKKDIKSLIY